MDLKKNKEQQTNDKNTNVEEKNKLKEDFIALQKYEKMLQNIIYTNERMNIDIKSIDIALSQLKTKQKEIFRFYGPILIKKNQNKIKKELENEKQEILEKQISIKKQQDIIKKAYINLREKIIAKQKQSVE
ncbi:MAG: hypothetical protein B6U87_02505 [Candidatus Aenigmarchaeota archaeon ex4484_52]|nr:MAG: hypothetical protein B6U87_02505 [Candidatus Aenigmarchaeota archaeon ex4484_52]